MGCHMPIGFVMHSQWRVRSLHVSLFFLLFITDFTHEGQLTEGTSINIRCCSVEIRVAEKTIAFVCPIGIELAENM